MLAGELTEQRIELIVQRDKIASLLHEVVELRCHACTRSDENAVEVAAAMSEQPSDQQNALRSAASVAT